MAKLQVRWMMEIEGFSERGEDEVGIQFGLVTVFDRVVRVDDVPRVTNLFPSGGFSPLPTDIDDSGRRKRAQGFVNSVNVPTVRNPYFGFVARGIEEDSTSNRDADYQRFRESIMAACRLVVEGEGDELPTTSDLWPAGHNARMEANIGDDDDRVSTTVRAFPEFGLLLPEAMEAEPTTPEGGVILPGPDESFVATFVGAGQSAGARYQTRVWISLVTNGGPQSEQLWGWDTP